MLADSRRGRTLKPRAADRWPTEHLFSLHGAASHHALLPPSTAKLAALLQSIKKMRTHELVVLAAADHVEHQVLHLHEHHRASPVAAGSTISIPASSSRAQAAGVHHGMRLMAPVTALLHYGRQEWPHHMCTTPHVGTLGQPLHVPVPCHVVQAVLCRGQNGVCSRLQGRQSPACGSRQGRQDTARRYTCSRGI